MKRTIFFTLILLIGFSSLAFLSAETTTNKTAAELFPLETFKKMLGSKLDPAKIPAEEPAFSLDEVRRQGLPSSYDWRSQNIMTGIRNQGSCGSCWAFAAVGVFESLIKMMDDKSVNLSEQHVVNCVSSGGCDGGYSSDALAYLMTDGGVMENQVPYQGIDGTCNSSLVPSYYLDMWWMNYLGSDTLADRVSQMKYAIYNYGPAAVSMDVYADFYYYYNSGVYVYDGTSSNMGGHAIVAVGWVDDASITNGGYWICKNSWGPGWGESGYFRIAYGQAEIEHWLRYASYSGVGNNPPVWEDFATSYEAREGDLLTIRARATDADNDTLIYSASNLPEGAQVFAETGNVGWTPSYTQSGSYTIIVKVTDGLTTIQKQIKITVSNVKKITK